MMDLRTRPQSHPASPIMAELLLGLFGAGRPHAPGETFRLMVEAGTGCVSPLGLGGAAR